MSTTSGRKVGSNGRGPGHPGEGDVHRIVHGKPRDGPEHEDPAKAAHRGTDVGGK